MRGVAVIGVVGALLSTPMCVVGQTDQAAPTALDSLLNLTVSAASLYAQKRTEAPAMVTVVSAEEIEAFGYRNLAEVLQSVAGFNTASDLQYTFVGVRGFGRPADLNHRVLFLIDGHTLNESVLGAAPIGNAFPVDVQGISTTC